MAKKTDVDSAIGTAVLLTGNQTIDGTKTFSSTISGSITGNAGSATTATTAGSCTGNSATATTASSCSGNSATATSATSATTATNLAGGSLGTIPYQSASGTTAQLSAGTSEYLLKSNGAAAPSWSSMKTVNGTSLLGSGNIVAGGSSTDYGAIGTYVVAGNSAYWNSSISANSTYAGSSLIRHNTAVPNYAVMANNGSGGYLDCIWRSDVPYTSLGLTGTWRCITNSSPGSSGTYITTTYVARMNTYVRIS
jgi:hypothetical protein